MPSPVRQVEMALMSIYAPELRLRKSKHQVSPELRSRLIFGARTLEVYLEWGCQFARWARKELLVRRLVEAPDLAGQAWVQSLIDARRSPWTVSLAISALRKLEWGVYTRWGVWVTLVDPAQLVGRQKRLLAHRKRKGAYPLVELRLLRLYLPFEYRSAMDACVALGLRRHEVIAVQARHVDLTATAYRVKGRGGVWIEKPLPSGYSGVVRVPRWKGGRPREIPIPDYYRDQLEDLVTGRDPSERLWAIQARAFGEAIAQAAREAKIESRGAHGFRHTWALQRLFHLMSLGYTADQARQAVSWWLGHNRLAVTSNYLEKRRASSFDCSPYVDIDKAE